MSTSKNILYLLTSLISIVAYSQNQKLENSYSASIFTGVILPHTEHVRPLKINNFYGLRASFGFRTDGSRDWHHTFNFPEYGAAFTAIDFGNDLLGKSFGLTGFYKFSIGDQSQLLNSHIRLDLGIAGHTSPYHPEKNPLNLAIGSSITAMITLSADMSVRLNQHTYIGPYVELLHFSNGNTKYPNYGLNAFAAGIRISYSPVIDLFEEIPHKPTEIKKRIRPTLAVSSGVSQPEGASDKFYPFLAVAVGIHKRFSTISGFNATLDYDYSTAKKAKSRNDPTQAISDGNSLGISLSYELFLGHISANFSLGRYLFNQTKSDPLSYQRLSIRYNIGSIYLGIALKAKGLSVAEELQYGLGYRF